MNVKTRRISLVTAVVMGLLAMTSVAMAEDDTEFSYGYDPDNHFLLINLAPLSPLDDTPTEEETCELDADTEYTITEGSVELTDTTNTEGCSVEAIDVTGPAGQINQGMFMKAFNAFIGTLDLEYGRGCLVRHLAQSGLGIDNQIQTPDADDEFVPGTGGTADFTTVLTDCEHPDNETEDEEVEFDTEGHGNGKGKGKGRPESPGKSASAPGRAGR